MRARDGISAIGVWNVMGVVEWVWVGVVVSVVDEPVVDVGVGDGNGG